MRHSPTTPLALRHLPWALLALLVWLLAVPATGATGPTHGAANALVATAVEHTGTLAPVVQRAAPCEPAVNPFQGPPVVPAKQRITGHAEHRLADDRTVRHAARAHRLSAQQLRVAHQRCTLLFPFHFFW